MSVKSIITSLFGATQKIDIRFSEITEIDVEEDPVRPHLDLKFRTTYNRKIFGLHINDQLHAIICVAFTNDVPTTEKEMDLMSKICYHEDNADTAIAYTVWSRKKGAGKLIMDEAQKYMKGRVKRLVTLAPLTPMATHYHVRNGAKLISLNPTTQNFEYEL